MLSRLKEKDSSNGTEEFRYYKSASIVQLVSENLKEELEDPEDDLHDFAIKAYLRSRRGGDFPWFRKQIVNSEDIQLEDDDRSIELVRRELENKLSS